MKLNKQINKMSIEKILTVKGKSPFINANSFKKNISLKKDSLNIELDDNFYENLFLEEMDFQLNPNKDKITNIIRQQCRAVEYFSSIEDNKKVSQYKTLIDLFLNNPIVINLLDNKDNNNNNSMKKILISNKNKVMNKLIAQDNIRLKYENNDIIIQQEEKDKLYNLINKNENMIKNKPSIDLINEEIKNQKNKFKKNFLIKKHSIFKKEKNINENKLIQSIQNAFINEKKDKQTNIYEEKDNNLSNTGVNNFPIKKKENSNNKENISNNIINSFSFSNNLINERNKENINQLNILINKKNTSEFEPLTPEIFSKINQSNNKSSVNNNYNNNSEEITETNDFSLNNENYTTSTNEDKDTIPKNDSLLKYNNICSNSNETKESENFNFSNITNSSQISKNLNNLNDLSIKNNKFKNFRLDFNDLFEFMKESHSINNKQKIFCKDIKLIIENYIKEYNQYLNENIFIKFVKKFSNSWDDMFKKYVNITEIYEKELKKIDEKINTFINEESKIKELENLSESLKNERENEINKSEEKFSSEIESISLDFKNNYNYKDKGILLLNEKFALIITKKIFDMINNI